MSKVPERNVWHEFFFGISINFYARYKVLCERRLEMFREVSLRTVKSLFFLNNYYSYKAQLKKNLAKTIYMPTVADLSIFPHLGYIASRGNRSGSELLTFFWLNGVLLRSTKPPFFACYFSPKAQKKNDSPRPWQWHFPTVASAQAEGIVDLYMDVVGILVFVGGCVFTLAYYCFKIRKDQQLLIRFQAALAPAST